MIMPPRTPGGGTDFGTLLEIRTVQMFPDGRSMVETWGVQRFRIIERGALDGYMVGRIELCVPLHAFSYQFFDKAVDSIYYRIDDFPLDVDDALHASTASPGINEQDLPPAVTGGLNRGVPVTNEELMELCHAFLNKLRSGTAPWVVQRLNHTYGPEPVDDPSNFSFWMALVSITVSLHVMIFLTHFSPCRNPGPADRRA
jgi:ATP-dependent protease La (LON) substrate-binding domain